MFRMLVPLVLLLATPVPGSSQSAPAPAPLAGPPEEVVLSDADKLYGLSKIWQEVTYNFAFFDQVPDLDWDSTYRAFIPQVIDTESTYEYYRVLQRFVALLGDGHTNVFLSPAMWERHERYAPWVDLQRVGGRLLVRNIAASLEAELPIGSELLSVQGRPVAEHLEREVLPYLAASTEHGRRDLAAMMLLRGPAGTPVQITFATPTGEMRERTLMRERALWSTEHHRPDRWVREETPRRSRLRWLEGEVAVVDLNTFATDSVAHDFESMLPSLQRARALVIDLRANGGGNSGVGYRVASWLTDDTLETSRWRTREHRAAHKEWGRYGEEHQAYARMDAWFDGGSHGRIEPNPGRRLVVPTAVLIGSGTGSAAEDFLVAIDALPHVILVGGASNGSTGQPLHFDLPGGGTARVVTKRDTYPDGRDFVGVGVQPDVRVEPSVEDVRAGRDPVLERAVALLRSRTAARPAP